MSAGFADFEGPFRTCAAADSFCTATGVRTLTRRQPLARMFLAVAVASLLATLALCGALCPSAAYAADADAAAGAGAGAAVADSPYTYTVRLFGGNQGTVEGGESKVYQRIPVGSRWSFDPSIVKVTNDKYYVKGIKLAGRQNDTAQAVVNTSSFVVDQDIDLVVVYGMKGSVTHYTVSYVDESGRELAPSQTFEGNVGDRPVVAYRYIDGYRPQAYNLTGTLTDNEANNSFVFTYSPVAAGDSGGAGAGGAAGAAGGTAAGATGGGAGADADAAADGVDAEGEGEGADAGDQEDAVEQNPVPTTDIAPDGVPLSDGPSEIESIDDNDVPLASRIADEGQSRVMQGLTSPAGIAIACLAVAVIGVAVWRFIVMRKRSRERAASRKD